MAGAFEGKVVLISGANGGLGQGVVTHFRDEGAKLALIERGAETTKSSEQMVVSGDVTDVDSMAAVVQQVVGHFGKIDAYVHTVGGYSAGNPVHSLDLNTWDKMMALNARAVYIATGTVAQQMVEQGSGGSIVVVLARAGFKGGKNQAAYSASKAAAHRIVESMAAELLEHGIRVNAVSPGTIDTQANRDAMPGADFSKWVKPEQLAAAIAFLVSDAASAISGDNVAVYGRS
ncbi:MAG: SDR family oxidoreductase [Anaerolineae bacterium]|nr:SDR family oxidoreductase [Anaerolineae bacterium]